MVGDKYRSPFGDMRPGVVVLEAQPEVRTLLKELTSAHTLSIRPDSCANCWTDQEVKEKMRQWEEERKKRKMPWQPK